jgi:hypothetical protein
MAGAGRAASYAWGIFAVITALGADLEFKLRVGTIGNLHDPVAAVTYRNIIFGLAGHDAVAAANAFQGIDGHCVSHDTTSLSGFSVKNVTKLPLIPVPPIMGSIRTFVISLASLAPLPYARLRRLSAWPKP